MQYKILESLGVEIENTDDAAFNNFLVSGESGIVKGVLDECKLVDLFGTVAIAKGELMIQGFRIKITEAYQYTPVGSAASRTNYHIVARLTLHEGGDVSFNIVTRTITELQQDDLHKLSSGIHEVELAQFTHYEDRILNLTPSIGFLSLAPILKPEFANSVDELNESGDPTKLYVLPDGYIYAYMYTEVVTEGSTNLLELAVESDLITPYNGGKGYKDKTRLNSSLVEKGDLTYDAFVTGYIPVKGNKPIRLNGNYISTKDVNAGSLNWACYDVEGNKLYNLSMLNIPTNSDAGVIKNVVLDGDYITQFTFNTDWTYQGVKMLEGLAYVRLSLLGSGEGCNISLDEPIVEPSVDKKYSWINTGHAFVPADYENRIVELEAETKELDEATAKNTEDISELNERVEKLEVGTSDVPTHWIDAIATAKEKVLAKQAHGGVDCVNFVWTSDIHARANLDAVGTRLGIVAKAIMDEVDIPLFVSTGDIMSQASYNTPDNIYVEEALAKKWLSPIPYYQQALIMGNHDGAWGDSSCYYDKQLPLTVMYNLIYRNQDMDMRRVSSANGTYYYLDNVSQKTRFIMLNSHNTTSEEQNADGTAVQNRFDYPTYCQTQLDWVANVALDMPEGYTACIFAHAPYDPADKGQLIGIVDAYNGKDFGNGKGKFTNTFTDSIQPWRNSTVNVDFSSAKGTVAAMFTGHIHRDTIDTSYFSTCPLITIVTSLGGDVRDKDSSGKLLYPRTDGTDTEFAMDIVTIDKTKTNRKIYMTRLGAGIDREIGY